MHADHIQVLEPIVVVVGDSHAHLVAVSTDSGFFSDVGKSSIAIVTVEPVIEAGIVLLKRG